MTDEAQPAIADAMLTGMLKKHEARISELETNIEHLAGAVEAQAKSIQLLREMIGELRKLTKGLWLRLNASDGYAPDAELYEADGSDE